MLKRTGFSQESFEAFLASREEPDWLTDGRRAAWQAFQDLPLPSRADEEWMRTDIRLFRLDKFALSLELLKGSASDAQLPPALLAHGVELGGRTATLNSQAVQAGQSELKSKWAKKGVLFGSLDELVKTHGELIRRHLFLTVNLHADKFSALHAACWSGGTLLYVPKSVVIDEPLHTLTALNEGGVDLSHILVILEEGAEATLLTETAGGALADQPESGLHVRRD